MEQKTIDFSPRIFILISIIVFSLVIYLFGSLYFNFKYPTRGYFEQFSVSGTGKVFAFPDVAILKIGLRSEAKDTKVLFEENTKRFNRILEEIKKLGIEEKDIKTTKYHLSPLYDQVYTEGRFTSVLSRYSLEQEIQIKIRDFSKIGQVLERSTSLGANLIEKVEFQVEDIEKYLSEARKLAIEDAKRKAKEISQASGLKLKKLINIREFSSYYYPDFYTSLGITAKLPALESTPEIRPGQQEIVVNVALIYEVE